MLSVICTILLAAALDAAACVDTMAAEPEPEPAVEYYGEWYEPVYYAPAYDMPTDGLTMQGGVNWHDQYAVPLAKTSGVKLNEWRVQVLTIKELVSSASNGSAMSVTGLMAKRLQVKDSANTSMQKQSQSVHAK